MNMNFRLVAVFLLLNLTLFASSKANVKIIEATENIRYLSQKIVKDYFFSYTYPKQAIIKNTLHSEINALSQNFRMIAITSENSDTKDILEFLSYNKEQMFELLEEKHSLENASIMIDYAETLTEGVDSIAQEHQYIFTGEEKLLMTSKKIKYLLQHILKYYMVIQSDLNSDAVKEMLDASILEVETKLTLLNAYEYPYDLQTERNKLNNAWQKSKILIGKSKELFVPILLFASVNYMERLIDSLASQHSKNR